MINKPISEVFPNLKLTDRLIKNLSDTVVNRVVISRQDGTVCVELTSSHLVNYRDISSLKKALYEFGGSRHKIRVIQYFNLSDAYTPEIFWTEYRESVILMMKEEDVTAGIMMQEASVSFDGNNLHIAYPGTFLYKKYQNDVERILVRAFRCAGFVVSIDFEAKQTDPSRQQFSDDIDMSDPYYQRIINANGSRLSDDRQENGTGASDHKKVGAFLKTAEDSHSADVSKADKEKAGNSSGSEKDHSSGSSGSSYGDHGNDAAPSGWSKNSQNGGKRFGGRSRINPDDPDGLFFGYDTDGEIVPLKDVDHEGMDIITNCQITKVEERETRSGSIIYMFDLTDFSDSISAKLFLDKEDHDFIAERIVPGKFLLIKGISQYDKYSHEISLSSIRGIKKSSDFRKKREDMHKGMKRVELHAHTKMSEMDSVMSVESYLDTAIRWGHTAAAITDHGVVQAFPDANLHCPDREIKIIYGCEIYLVDDLIKPVADSRGQSFDDSYVVFDLETTGIGPKTHKIIEIGAVKVVHGQIKDRFSTFVDPEEPIPYQITELTSIRDSDVASYGNYEKILPEFLDFCQGSVLVAHNASFDYGFIKHYAGLLGRQINFTVVDTVGMARLALPELSRFKLDTVAKALKVDLGHHHRAVDDAECTANIFIALAGKLKDSLQIHDLDALSEKYSVDDNVIRKLHSHHAIVLAKNETGRINLYKLVSKSHVKYYHKRPLVPKSMVEECREGLILGSACSQGELYEGIQEEKSDAEIDRIVRFYDYLEIQPIGNNKYMIGDEKHFPDIQDEEDLKEINRKIIALGEEYHKPVVGTCDVHFLNPEDEVYRRIMQKGKGFDDADDQAPIFFRTTDEMLKEFDYLGDEKAREVVITNTNLIADMIDYIKPVSPRKCPPVIQDSDKTLREICSRRAHEIYGPDLPPIVEKRLDRELNSIIGNGYAVMYIIAQKLVWKSNEDGYLVGSRGSVGSSFVANMAGITEVNSLSAHYYCPKCHYYDFDSEDVKKYAGWSACDMPDKTCPKCGTLMKKDGHDIPFETFLGFKGNKEPDIDLNFSSEYQSNAHNYTEVIFGAGQTYKAGTVSGVQDKTAFGYVKKYCEEKGITKRRAEIERLAAGIVGVRRTTGQHPGGIVVLPVGEDINTFTPVQHPANDPNTSIVTTHFDYHKIDANLLKLDILGHQDPTMIRELVDLTGIDIAKVPIADPDVISLFESTKALGITPDDIGGCKLGCLGLPEFGTNFVISMLQDAKPKSFSDLVRVSGLSHGTDVWLNNAQYYITHGYCTLSSAICCRDDIMIYLIGKGIENEEAFNIMERVRKGKVASGKCKEWPGWVADMKAHGVPDWYIESCQKIKYMFPKAHAVAYVMMATRVAWFKVHEPLAYYSAYFSIRATAFDYELMAMGQSSLLAHMADYESRQAALSDQEQAAYENMKIVREMYARGFLFTPIDIYKAHANRFQIVDGKLMPSFLAINGLGDKAAEMLEAEAAKGPFLSKEDIKKRAKVPQAVIDKMSEWGLLSGLSDSNQMSIFDFMS